MAKSTKELVEDLINGDQKEFLKGVDDKLKEKLSNNDEFKEIAKEIETYKTKKVDDPEKDKKKRPQGNARRKENKETLIDKEKLKEFNEKRKKEKKD